MLIKVIVLLMFGAIFFSMGSALFYLVRDRDHSTRTVKALTWRIVLSIALFLLLLLAFAMGWLVPHTLL
jgi:hypothetical protein